MKIIALTSIRSEYDLLSELYRSLDSDKDIDFRLVVGGAHNSLRHGNTYEDIVKDGFNILCKIESLLDSDSATSRIKSASILLLSIIDIVNSFGPDLIIYAGDREEVLIGAMLGAYLGVPTMHFFGGDHAADGHVDNPIRHAASKLSTCHLVSTSEHKKRLQAIGEPNSRIFNIGSVALDKFVNTKVIRNVADSIHGAPIKKKIALFVFHPVSGELACVQQIINDSLKALFDSNYHVFIGFPNSDLGSSDIFKAIEKALVDKHDYTFYGNLDRERFVNLFRSSSLIAGNSSAGILEAASIPIPCINIGQRQRGRCSGSNVVFVNADYCSIKQGIDEVNSDVFIEQLSDVKNPYGDGKAVDNAMAIIKENDFRAMFEKKEDPLSVQS
jgi:UDP-hydrolysing UDP-N-acetyl-D-glucosamine 2-epimerase